MIRTLRLTLVKSNYGIWLIVAAVLALALWLGQRASATTLGVLVAAMAGMLLLARPWLGLPALILAALLWSMEISTGSEVTLNPATVLLPALLGLWLLMMAVRGRIALVRSPVNLPLLLLLATGLLSLFVGLMMWDTVVPRGGNFLLVQLAQWAIYALSGGALLITGNLIRQEAELRRLTFSFLLLGGVLVIVKLAPIAGGLIGGLATEAINRPPFWVLLAGLAGGQLLFNRELTRPWRIFLLVIVGLSIYYGFGILREAASNWVGLTVTGAVLGWLRWPRLRWISISVLLALVITGLLFPAVYNFAGGDEEWITSGGSRLALITRVVEDTITHNPVTGLGPAAYRAYGATRPLQYEHIVWILPRISAHNNYVDIFGHFGALGLVLFGWLALAIGRIGLGLRRQSLSGFAAGYVNGMLAVWAGSLALMLLADWILPFVYNIGFPGFQASLLLWLFLGGLPALAAMATEEGLHTQANQS